MKVFLASLAMIACPGTAAAAPVTISRAALGNVDAGQFSVFWQVNDNTVPRLDIFSDAGGTTSLNGQLGVEFYPLEMNTVTVAHTAAQRAARRSLQAEMRATGIVYASVTGAQSGATYYVRPRSFDSAGVPNESSQAALIPVTTPAETAFVIESRQLRVNALCVAESQGMVMQLSMTGAPYPLLAVVGDHELNGTALFDLTRLLNAVGTTNAALTGTPQFTLELLAPGAPLDVIPTTVNYSSAFVVAQLTDTGFFVTFPGLASFTVEAINPPLQGAPFLLNITARTSDGSVLASYNGNVTVSTGAAGDLFEGTGITPAFTNGVLAGYQTVPAIAGPLSLTVARPCGAETGSANFTVTALSLPSWRQHYFGPDAGNDTISGFGADPDGDDVTNGVEYYLGWNPGRFESSPFTASRLDENTGEFVFDYWSSRIAPGVANEPVWGPDLLLSRTDLVTHETIETAGAFQHHRIRIAAAGQPRVFAGLRVNQVTTFTFPGLASFTIEAVNEPLQGAPFLLDLTARAADGSVLTTFNGTVNLTAGGAGDLFEGAGATPSFVNGVLAGYQIVPALGGPLTLTATNSHGPESGGAVFNVTALSLTTWRQRYFGADAGNNAVAGFDADPDGDGLVNVAEYYLGLQPRRFDPLPFLKPELSPDGGEFVFHFWHARLAPGVSGQVVWGPDLSLSRIDLVTQQVVETAGPYQRTQIEIAVAGLDRVFAGLRVRQP